MEKAPETLRSEGPSTRAERDGWPGFRTSSKPTASVLSGGCARGLRSSCRLCMPLRLPTAHTRCIAGLAATSATAPRRPRADAHECRPAGSPPTQLTPDEGSCGGGGAPRDSAGSGATEEGLTSRGGRNLRLPLRFGLRTFHFHALEKEMATHSSVLAWRSQEQGSLVGFCLWGCT